MEATALLKSAGQQLGKWMVEEAKYLRAVKGKVEELQHELEWIQCFLRSADKKKGNDELVQKWISEINDFSYEAEDIVEKYLLKVSSPKNWNVLRWSTCCLGDVISTHQVGSEIDVLTSKISKLTSRMITYGVEPGSSSSPTELRRSHSHIPVDDIVGLKEDTDILVGHLMNKEKKVIAISGMGGSGKTTLARNVYHAVKKGLQFEMCAWVYVSQKFHSRDVIQEIYLRLYADDEKKRNEIRNAGEVEGELYKVLENHKCLVVLDDIWNSDNWDSLKNAFPPTSKSSSKLLITTRSNNLLFQIVDQFSEGLLHEPKYLDEKESFQLFYKKAALGKYTKSRDPEAKQLLEKKINLGMQMVAKCKGFPLAIVVLGGILAPKKTLDEWKSIHKNVETILSGKNFAKTGAANVLELSYTDLPYHLRPCFLHLGNFPAGFEIQTKKLYRMWIAEGIVAPRNEEYVSLEDTASSYLKELVQRCIVQVGKTGAEEKIKTCRLHDLMSEMCTLKAKEENFLSIVRQESVNVGYGNVTAIRDGNLHRLAIHFGESLQSSFTCLFNKASHLRSLMFFTIGSIESGDEGWLKTMINDFKLLRVLDLENTGIQEVPRVLGNLFRLRYLSIMGTRVRKLPSSIGNLRCLQTLDLRVLPDDCVMRIPNVLWRMKRLKHLYLPSHAYKVKRFQKLRVRGLSNLEILKNFDSKRSRVNDLHKLEKLRKLSIKNEVSKTEILKIIIGCQSIENHSLLHLSLKIHGSILNEEATILSQCTCLHTLEMAGTELAGTKLMLECFKFPVNLKILVIRNCELNCVDPMQIFKQLRILRSLSLDGVSFLGDSMDCSDGGFLQLVDMRLSKMNTLKEWTVGKKAMPKLHCLQIYDCEELQMIPDGLPASVEVVCRPCVNGIDRYFTCPFHNVALKDDDDDDLATRQCSKHFS